LGLGRASMSVAAALYEQEIFELENREARNIIPSQPVKTKKEQKTDTSRLTIRTICCAKGNIVPYSSLKTIAC
jgi:hypothetical protein